MSNVYSFLPKLTVNRQFIGDFLAAQSPCFALGLVEERKQQRGFLALRPGETIPSAENAAGYFASWPVGTLVSPRPGLLYCRMKKFKFHLSWLP